MMTNLLIPFDTYERNRKISRFLKSSDRVLDVGGGATGIKLFTHAAVKTLDLTEGDIKADARSLAIAADSFNVVTCIDVLEHIPSKDRPQVVANLVRIAMSTVIICTPYGSNEHEAAEKKLLNDLKIQGVNVSFLIEHVRNGLSTPDEVINKQTLPAQLFFSGDFRFSNWLFRLHVFELENPILNRLFYYFKVLLNIILNIGLYPFWFYSQANPFTNRFYVILKK